MCICVICIFLVVRYVQSNVYINWLSLIKLRSYDHSWQLLNSALENSVFQVVLLWGWSIKNEVTWSHILNLYNIFLIHPSTVNAGITQPGCRQLSKRSGESIGSGLIDTVFQFWLLYSINHHLLRKKEGMKKRGRREKASVLTDIDPRNFSPWEKFRKSVWMQVLFVDTINQSKIYMSAFLALSWGPGELAP